MAKKNVRVKIPSDPTALIELAAKIEKKHADLGAASPLKSLEDAEAFGPAVTRAKTQDDLATDFSSKAETAYGERDKDLPAVKQGVRNRRDALLATHASNPKKLTEWGFDVSDSPQGSDGDAAAKPAAGK